MDNLSGRVAVVTGAASGIGLGMCLRFAAEGMRIVMVDLQGPALAEASERVRKIGGEVFTASADVSDWEAIQKLAQLVSDRYGTAHIVCNNAGVRSMGSIWETTIEDWRWVLNVNFWGVLHGIKAFVPLMIKGGEPGHIVNTASVAGLLSFKGSAPYSASKSGVVSLTEALSQELREVRASIGVSVLCPGGVPTNFRENSNRLRPSGELVQGRSANASRSVTADDVAERVIQAIRSDQFWILTHPEYGDLIERRARGILHTGQVVAGEMP